MSSTLNLILALVGLCFVLSLGALAYQQWQAYQRHSQAEAAILANSQHRAADQQARQQPDSLVAGLAGQRRENARHATSLRRLDDSLSRLRHPLAYPAVPPVEQ